MVKKWNSAQELVERSKAGPLSSPPASCGCDLVLLTWVWKIPWRRKWLPTRVFLPGEFHGQRSLVDYSLWGLKDLDITE